MKRKERERDMSRDERKPANDKQFHFRGALFAKMLPEIDGEDGAGGVEDGSERGDERGEGDRDEGPPESCGQQAESEQRVGHVGATTRDPFAAEAVAHFWLHAEEFIWVEHPGDHARHNDDEHGQHLQVARHHAAQFRMSDVARREYPLYDHLGAEEEKHLRLQAEPASKCIPNCKFDANGDR